MRIRKKRGIPPSLETQHRIRLAQHAFEDALKLSNKRLTANESSGLCEREGMCPLNSQILRIQM